MYHFAVRMALVAVCKAAGNLLQEIEVDAVPMKAACREQSLLFDLPMHA